MDDMKKSCTRLVLGTAQLGLDYGVSNTAGKPSADIGLAILECAWAGGIRAFDTAHAYGSSESVLGDAFQAMGIQEQAKVTSKFPVDQRLDDSSLNESVDASLKNLRVSHIETMLFHRDDVLESWERIVGILESIRASGRVKKFGVSCYEPDRALKALECSKLDAVQVSASVLDHRFLNAGAMQVAHLKNVSLYIRSVFLQGLLLMNPDDLPKKVAFTEDAVRRFAGVAERVGLDRDELALCYVRDRWPKANILIGAETVDQIKKNISLWQKEVLSEDILMTIGEIIGQVDERIVRPDKW
jgi:aryl-alcohol dehydrogenase-like predicted oxidoreductase